MQRSCVALHVFTPSANIKKFISFIFNHVTPILTWLTNRPGKMGTAIAIILYHFHSAFYDAHIFRINWPSF